MDQSSTPPPPPTIMDSSSSPNTSTKENTPTKQVPQPKPRKKKSKSKIQTNGHIAGGKEGEDHTVDGVLQENNHLDEDNATPPRSPKMHRKTGNNENGRSLQEHHGQHVNGSNHESNHRRHVPPLNLASLHEHGDGTGKLYEDHSTGLRNLFDLRPSFLDTEIWRPQALSLP